MKETLELDPAALMGRGDEWKVWNEAELRLLHTWGKSSLGKCILSPIPGDGVGGAGWLLPGLTCAAAEAASSLSDSSSLLSESSCTSALTWATAGPAFPGSPGVVRCPEGPWVGAEAAFTGRLFPTDFTWNDMEKRHVTGAKGPRGGWP